MKILYTSCHSILEYDEISLFSELGHDVFSNGAYLNPAGHYMLPRPGIPSMNYYPEFADLAAKFPKTQLPQQLIDWADAIIIMHDPYVLAENWPRIKHKKVVWRSIGQSLSWVEKIIEPMRNSGLKIVRYSPKESAIPNFSGQDVIIRFYKDQDEWTGWNGSDKRVVNFTQSLKGRRHFCHYDHLMEIMAGFPSIIYGTGNEDLGGLNGGNLPYEDQKQKLRDARVMAYTGTWPACYTLSLIEAMMTGTPIVAIGKNLAENVYGVEKVPFYEVHEIIRNGDSGFVGDSIEEIKSYIKMIMTDDALANKLSIGGRRRAIELFGKSKIKSEWDNFLKRL